MSEFRQSELMKAAQPANRVPALSMLGQQPTRSYNPQEVLHGLKIQSVGWVPGGQVSLSALDDSFSSQTPFARREAVVTASSGTAVVSSEQRRAAPQIGERSAEPGADPFRVDPRCQRLGLHGAGQAYRLFCIVVRGLVYRLAYVLCLMFWRDPQLCAHTYPCMWIWYSSSP